MVHLPLGLEGSLGDLVLEVSSPENHQNCGMDGQKIAVTQFSPDLHLCMPDLPSWEKCELWWEGIIIDLGLFRG